MRRSLRPEEGRIDLWDKAAIQSEIGEMDPEIEAGLRSATSTEPLLDLAAGLVPGVDYRFFLCHLGHVSDRHGPRHDGALVDAVLLAATRSGVSIIMPSGAAR